MSSPSHATPARSRSVSTSTALARLARDRFSRVLLVVLAVIGFAVYATVLPSEEASGRLSLSNWTYLTGLQWSFSIVLALGLATVLTVQVYAARQALAARRSASGRAALGGFGFLASLVPSLCCSPVLSTVLALFGVGAGGATATMKTIAPYATVILMGTVVLFVLLVWWSIRRLACHTAVAREDGECCGREHSASH